MNKKGDYKHDILMYLILGILVLGISLFFIFQEFWSEDDTDREVCAQSIQLRAMMPDVQKAKLGVVEFKSDFPLQCKTSMVEISKRDVEDMESAQRKVAESMAECWALYGTGDYDVFPTDFYSLTSICVPCARIHLSEDAKDYMVANNINIDIESALNLQMREGYTYYSYLKNSGDRFSSFDLASSAEFDLGASSFEVDDSADINAVFINRLTGGKDESFSVNFTIFNYKLGDYKEVSLSKLKLPKFLKPEEGDLIINYGVITSTDKSNVGKYIPYLFYFQSMQSGNPFEEVKKDLIDGFWWKNTATCESWEGIPA